MTVAPDRIAKLASNQDPHPYEILGCHARGDGLQEVRAYQPHATAVWAIDVQTGKEYPLQPAHHPDFFVGIVPPLERYQLRLESAEGDRLIFDPYSLRPQHLTEFDLFLFGEGNHFHLYEKLGAHCLEVNGVAGVYFAVWAPHARNVSVIGAFNDWDGRIHQMNRNSCGIWEIFIPELGVGDGYLFEVKNSVGHIYKKTDPFGFQQAVRPHAEAIVTDLGTYLWRDRDWLEARARDDVLKKPVAIYMLHLGSWQHAAMTDTLEGRSGGLEPVAVSEFKPDRRFLTYYELAERLIPYVCGLGFTHIEILPLCEHPVDGSWGCQVTGYYACTSRFGPPEAFMYFIDCCHQAGLGVILDWIPNHFSKAEHGLAFFDGSHLYESADPCQREYRDWGTLSFDLAKPEVRNYLLANALFWFDKYHIDGLRFDATTALLYRDYRRKEGEWTPNVQGGREYLEGIDFLRQTNATIFSDHPGILTIAEETSAWPLVSRPPYNGGLGFNLVWDFGWEQNVLDYFTTEPRSRQHYQSNITFSLSYAYTENHVLALPHHEVMGSGLAAQLPGDTWQKLANLRCLLAYTYAHPGKKLLFAGTEFGQWSEWDVWSDLDWSLLEVKAHAKLEQFTSDLNGLYRREAALWEQDFDPAGFEWIDYQDSRHSVLAFMRRSSRDFIVVACNFTPQPHSHYRIGVPEFGFYRELLNSDAREYGGSNLGNLGGKWSERWPYHRAPFSLDLCLPPLGVLFLKCDRFRAATEARAGSGES